METGRQVDHGIDNRPFILEVYVDRYSQSPNLYQPFADAGLAITEGRRIMQDQDMHTVCVSYITEVNGRGVKLLLWRHKSGGRERTYDRKVAA